MSEFDDRLLLFVIGSLKQFLTRPIISESKIKKRLRPGFT